MICFALAVIVVLFIRLIRPFVIVRIGMIDVGRIGGIYDGDWYLSEKVDGKHSGRYFDLFYCQKSTSHVNEQWLKMWKRSLPLIYGTAIWEKVHRLIKTQPGFAKHIIPATNILVSYEEQMTYLDGNDLDFVYSNIKEESQLENIPIIIVTIGDYNEMSSNFGASGFIKKPIQAWST